MKKIIIFSGILILTLFWSCGSKKNEIKEKKAITKENLLDGLHNPDMSGGFPTNFSSQDIPAYTEDGIEISREEMKKKTSSREFTAVPYSNAQNEMVLWLIRPMTEKEKAMFIEFENKRNNIPNLKDKIAKPFDVTDILGTQYSLKDLKGKIIVMNFWFIGCKPCVMEINDLNALVDKCKGKNVVFLGFANDKKENLVAFLKKKPFKYSIIPDSKAVSDSYGIKVSPTNLVVDQNSMITYHSTGLDSAAPNDMLTEIERLLK